MVTMIYLLSIIHSTSPDKFQSAWMTMVKSRDDFDTASLYHVFENFLADYQFVSVISWKSLADYQKNPDPFSDAQLKPLIDDINQNIYKKEYTTRKNYPVDDNNIYLINPFEIRNDQIDDCLSLWQKDNAFMQSQNGAIGTNLYKVTDINNKFKFINIAEWQRRIDWLAAFKSETFAKFMEVRKAKQHKIYPSLTRRVATISNS